MKRFFKYLFLTNPFTAFYLYFIHKFPKAKTASFLLFGKKVFLRPGTSDFNVLNQVFFDNQYDVLEYIKNPKIIVDGGANIGTSTLYFKNHFPEATIFCFEPNTSNFEVLKKNTRDYAGIKLFKLGMWSKTIEIFLNKKMGFADFYVTETKGEDTIESVECMSISDFISTNKIDFIDILKLDIEGAEKTIFEHNTEWLAQVGCIMIETHDRFVHGCSIALFKALEGFDYTLEVSGETLKFFNLKRIDVN